MTKDGIIRRKAIRARQTALEGQVLLPLQISHSVSIFFAFIIVLSVALWGVFVPLPVTASVEGQLVPEDGLAAVRAMRGGWVVALPAQSGKRFSAGEQLAEIGRGRVGADGSDVIAAQLDILDDEAVDLDAALLRFQRERNNVSSDFEQFRDHHAEIERSRSRLLALQEKVLLSAHRAFLDAKHLYANGLVPKVELEGRRQAWLQAQKDIELIRLDQKCSAQQLSEAKSDSEAVRRAVIAEAETVVPKLRDLQRARLTLSADKGESILAPVDAVVADVLVNVGDTIEPGQPVIVLAPAAGPLIAELMVPGHVIAHVRRGQSVQLDLKAVPARRHGYASAHVIGWSEARVQDSPASARQDLYRLRALIDSGALPKGADQVRLLPGMTIRAEIILGTQTLFERLWAPIGGAA